MYCNVYDLSWGDEDKEGKKKKVPLSTRARTVPPIHTNICTHTHAHARTRTRTRTRTRSSTRARSRNGHAGSLVVDLSANRYRIGMRDADATRVGYQCGRCDRTVSTVGVRGRKIDIRMPCIDIDVQILCTHVPICESIWSALAHNHANVNPKP